MALWPSSFLKPSAAAAALSFVCFGGEKCRPQSLSQWCVAVRPPFAPLLSCVS